MAAPLPRRAVLAGLAAAPLIGGAAARGRAAPAKRLVTIGAPVTEIVAALGEGDAIVATDTTSHFPPQVEGLPRVGYMRSLAAEGLLSLSPTHLLAQDGSGPPHVLEQIAALGVRVTLVPERPDLDGLKAKVTLIANAIDRQAAGDALNARLADRFAALPRPAATRGAATLCLIHAGTGAPMAAGAGTVADLLIGLAGGHNAMAALKDYQPLSVEAAIAAQPQALLVSHATIAQAGGLDALLALPVVAPTPAAATRRVAVVDGSLLLGLGPRTPDAVQALAGQLSKA